MGGKEKLKYLFDKYFSSKTTSEENLELAKLVEEADTETLSSMLEDSWDLGAANPVFTEGERSEIIHRILGEAGQRQEPATAGDVRVLSGVDEQAVGTETRRSVAWWKYAAAAAVIALVSTVVLYNSGDEAGTAPVQVVASSGNDLLPGQDGAILTLANGEKVLLDSLGNGVVTMQGAIQVINQQGKLSYVQPGGSESRLMYNTMATPKGRQYQLVLSDGSKVWLNAASSIRYPIVFTGNERRVFIDGEAYFEVSRDRRKPFRVEIEGRGTVEVLGTQFNINAYDDEPTVNTTLIEGSVKVTVPGARSSVLKPGQQAQISDGLQVISDVNTDEVVAWKNGYFSFNGATTEAIMRQVMRWYDAEEIIYEGDVKNERFGGSVPRSANAKKLLEVLELTKTVRFTIDDKKIIVKPYR